MVQKLEVAVREGLRDPFAESIKNRVQKELGIELPNVRTKQVYLLDTNLTKKELEDARENLV